MSSPAKTLVGPRSFEVAVGTAITRNRRLKMNANGTVQHATNLELSVGIADADMPAAAADRTSGNFVAVQSLNADGCLRMTASTAITQGDQLARAVDGKVTTGADMPYICLNSNVGADGDLVLAWPLV